MIVVLRSAVLLAASLATAAVTAAISVADDTGRRVTLTAPAQRIVTLAPHATELVLAAGAGDRLAAAAVGGPLPETLAALPRIGGPGALDREALLALRPDLVIGWRSGNRATDLNWIEHSGTALYLSEPRTLGDIARAIRAIGTLSNREASAHRAAGRFEAGLDTPCRDLPPRAVYVAVWEHPAMSIGGQHWINAVLRRAGYRNVFEDYPRGVFLIAAEARHAQRPAEHLDLSSDAGDPDGLGAILSRPGPRLAEAVRRLCERRLNGMQ